MEEKPSEYYSNKSYKRLATELALLSKSEREYGIRRSGQLRQMLVEWADALLPDAIPPAPSWVRFEWPRGEEVNYESYWKDVDRAWYRERL